MILAGDTQCSLPSDKAPGSKPRSGHPWWVREVDKPLLDIDDRVYNKFNPRANVFGSFSKYVGVVFLAGSGDT